jgi:hypothetical protein
MQKYIVQQGDSISAISKILYGDFSKTHEICKLNNLVDCNLVHPGQELTVPDPTNVQDAQVVSTTTSDATMSKTKTLIGKWFPWIIVAGAAVLLAREANKQSKKNKDAAKPKALGYHEEKPKKKKKKAIHSGKQNLNGMEKISQKTIVKMWFGPETQEARDFVKNNGKAWRAMQEVDATWRSPSGNTASYYTEKDKLDFAKKVQKILSSKK